jgi:hypothetical protein
LMKWMIKTGYINLAEKIFYYEMKWSILCFRIWPIK